jgi:hypothetical protein
MENPMGHDHLKAEHFAFREDRHTGVYICKRVADGAPILHVAHEEEGDWQFLCGGEHEDGSDDGPLLVCLEHVVAQDPTTNALASMCTMHRADRATPEAEWTITDEREQFIRDMVEDPGWAVQLVSDGDDDEPAFAYTIGLYRNFGHPEIIIIGLRLPVMNALLNVCGDRIKAGETLPIHTPFSGVLDDYDVKLGQVRAPASYDEHLGYAIWFYNGREFPVVQLVWPDKTGRFPGEDGVAESVRKLQPLLP